MQSPWRASRTTTTPALRVEWVGIRITRLWTVPSVADMPYAALVCTAMAAVKKSGAETWMPPTSWGVPSGSASARRPLRMLLQRASRTHEDCFPPRVPYQAVAPPLPSIVHRTNPWLIPVASHNFSIASRRASIYKGLQGMPCVVFVSTPSEMPCSTRAAFSGHGLAGLVLWSWNRMHCVPIPVGIGAGELPVGSVWDELPIHTAVIAPTKRKGCP